MIRTAVTPDQENGPFVEVPGAFWAMQPEETMKRAIGAPLDRQTVIALWAYLGRTDPPFDPAYLMFSTEDLDREFPPNGPKNRAERRKLRRRGRGISVGY